MRPGRRRPISPSCAGGTPSRAAALAAMGAWPLLPVAPSLIGASTAGGALRGWHAWRKPLRPRDPSHRARHRDRRPGRHRPRLQRDGQGRHLYPFFYLTILATSLRFGMGRDAGHHDSQRVRFGHVARRAGFERRLQATWRCGCIANRAPDGAVALRSLNRDFSIGSALHRARPRSTSAASTRESCSFTTNPLRPPCRQPRANSREMSGASGSRETGSGAEGRWHDS